MARGTGRRVSKLATVAAVALAFGVGVGATVLLTRDGGGDDASVDSKVDLGDASEPIDPVDPSVPARLRAADSPEAAVRGFLDAEMQKDFQVAFDYLSDANRATFGTAAGYVAAHADLVPPVTGYEIEEVTGDRVVATVQYEPSLDAVVGLVPARARNTYVVVGGPGGFGVDLEQSASEPSYPSDGTAPAAVTQWVQARIDCRAENEWAGGLLGSPALAEPLCDTEDREVRVGGPEPVGPNEGAPFSAAFGDEVGVWGRVVPVEAPIAIRVVVAPIGEQWTVIGVLGSGPGAGL